MPRLSKLVLLLFFGSGAAALVYEVTWSKYLSLVLGSTVQAQSTVLAVFMGGLAVGNHWFGRWAVKCTRPLLWYGAIEIVIGAYAFFFHEGYLVADGTFGALGQSITEQAALLLGLKITISLLLLALPTVLMGGTLPVLAAWLQQVDQTGAARWVTRFYSVNTLGAVFGAWVSAFWLVPSVGLVSTLQVTGLANIALGCAAVLCGRNLPRLPSDEPAQSSPAESKSSRAQRPLLPLALVAMTGAASMGLEVLASRMLTLVFGASMPAFAVVLMAFILGIGFGSTWVASPRLQPSRFGPLTALLLVGASAWLAVIVLRVETWMDFYRLLRLGFARNETGYDLHQLLIGGLSLFILGVPAALLGAVLPLSIRIAAPLSTSLSESVGRLVTWNTLGGVVGVILTGFIIMPRIGLCYAVIATCAALAAAGLAVALRTRSLGGIVLGTANLAVCAASIGTVDHDWQHTMSSGIYRSRETTFRADALSIRRRHIRILFYEDAADATVSVEQGDGVRYPTNQVLRVNGKPDATTRSDLATQLLLAHLPLLARPAASNVFVLGLGSGITAGAVLEHPVAQLVIAENCAPVVRAAELFSPYNRSVLTQPRTRLWVEDARTVLKLRPETYDVIISEPSNPWMAGIGSVFSQEFYQLAARRLTPGGIMAQWFHVYEMNDGIVEMILRTFSSVFPQVEIWDASPGDIILLGARTPWTSGPAVFSNAAARSGVRRDLESIGIRSPATFWARQLASQNTAALIPGSGSIQSDLFPHLEHEAPEAFFVGANAQCLTAFDERVWQLELAPPEKRQALTSLNRADLAETFGEFGSTNPELDQRLRALFAASHDAVPAQTPVGYRYPPSLLLGPSEPALAVNRSALGPELRRLTDLEILLREGSSQPDAFVEDVLSALQAYRARTERRDHDWLPSQMAQLFARLFIQAGRPDAARAVIRAGLEAEPASWGLQFLSRWCEQHANSKATAPSR